MRVLRSGSLRRVRRRPPPGSAAGRRSPLAVSSAVSPSGGPGDGGSLCGMRTNVQALRTNVQSRAALRLLTPRPQMRPDAMPPEYVRTRRSAASARPNRRTSSRARAPWRPGGATRGGGPRAAGSRSWWPSGRCRVSGPRVRSPGVRPGGPPRRCRRHGPIPSLRPPVGGQTCLRRDAAPSAERAGQYVSVSTDPGEGVPNLRDRAGVAEAGHRRGSRPGGRLDALSAPVLPPQDRRDEPVPAVRPYVSAPSRNRRALSATSLTRGPRPMYCQHT